MAPLEASIVFGIELGENVTVTLASANLLMLGAVSSPKIIFLFYFYNMAALAALEPLRTPLCDGYVYLLPGTVRLCTPMVMGVYSCTRRYYTV